MEPSSSACKANRSCISVRGEVSVLSPGDELLACSEPPMEKGSSSLSPMRGVAAVLSREASALRMWSPMGIRPVMILGAVEGRDTHGDGGGPAVESRLAVDGRDVPPTLPMLLSRLSSEPACER